MHAWLGDTALHAAVKLRKAVAMHALLLQGADTHRLVNAMGHTASDLCEQVGCRGSLSRPLSSHYIGPYLALYLGPYLDPI
jgi:ankyrin repeat protein